MSTTPALEKRLLTIDDYHAMIAAEIPHYWVVNLQEHQLEVYAQPAKGRYKLRQIYLLDETVEIASFGIEVEVEKLLGSA